MSFTRRVAGSNPIDLFAGSDDISFGPELSASDLKLKLVESMLLKRVLPVVTASVNVPSSNSTVYVLPGLAQGKTTPLSSLPVGYIVSFFCFPSSIAHPSDAVPL
jgi:hypothetical protein